METVDGVFDVAVDGGLAYALSWRYGLRIVDVADPARPFEVGFYDPPERASAVAVADEIAYVCAVDLQLVDVADPSQPRLLGRWTQWDRGPDLPESLALDVWVVGDLAYVSTSTHELVILDVSDPAVPAEVGRYEGGGGGGRLIVRDDTAYIAAGFNGLRLVDVSDPTAPRPLGEYRSEAWRLNESNPGSSPAAEDLWLEDGVVVVAAGDDGVHVVDVTRPAQPRLVRRFAVPPVHNRHRPTIWSIAGAQGHLLLGSGYGVIEVVAIVDVLKPTDDDRTWVVPARTVETEGTVQALVLVGDRFYAAASFAGLRIFDLEAVLGN